MHDARTRWTTEVPQSNRIVDTSGHERVVRGRHLQTDYSLRVTLEVSEELVVVQGKVSTIVTKCSWSSAIQHVEKWLMEEIQNSHSSCFLAWYRRRLSCWRERTRFWRAWIAPSRLRTSASWPTAVARHAHSRRRKSLIGTRKGWFSRTQQWQKKFIRLCTSFHQRNTIKFPPFKNEKKIHDPTNLRVFPGRRPCTR